MLLNYNVPSSELAPPRPLQASVSPLEPKGGGGKLACGRGVEGSQFGRLETA
jgi:hypothetical protein